MNQWRNTDSVTNWFNTIENKSKCFFIQLHIVEFYASISENVIDTAINFAKQYTDISDENLRIIKHCRKSLLYNNHEPWKKKGIDSCFDVTMGSYDGAEVCELVGIYLLSLLANIIWFIQRWWVNLFTQCEWTKNGSCKKECNKNLQRS